MENCYFIMRHGQTAYQEEKKEWTYPSDGKTSLSPRGREMVCRAAEMMEEPLDIIYASDFRRTLETAKIVSAKKGVKIYRDKRLRDTNLGKYHGGKKEEFYRDYSIASKRFFIAPPGGEAWEDVLKRTWDMVGEIEKSFYGKNILVVSHGDPLWLLECKWMGFSHEEALAYAKEKYIMPAEIRKLGVYPKINH